MKEKQRKKRKKKEKQKKQRKKKKQCKNISLREIPGTKFAEKKLFS